MSNIIRNIASKRTLVFALAAAALASNAARADVILTGDIFSFAPGSDLRVGQTGSGQMTVNNGSVVNLVAGGNPLDEPNFIVGRLPGSSGQVSIDGPGSAINLISSGLSNTSAPAHIGREGTGTMSITNGGALRLTMDPNATPATDTLSPNITVGRDATGTGSLTVSNGSVLVEGAGAIFYIGRIGGTGTVDFSNGSTLQMRNTLADPDGVALFVGRDSNAVGTANFSNTQVTLDGGTSSSGIFAGRETGANGSISFNGPGTTVNITAGTDAFLTIGRDATTQGQVIVGGGAQMGLTGQRGSIDLGRNAGATGELRITGGSVVDLSGSTLDADAIVGGSFASKTSAGKGTLLIDGVGSHLDLGNSSNANVRRVIIGAATTLGGVSSDGGHVTVRNGGLLTADVVNVGINGVLDGNGQINAKVSLEGGTIAPGNSPGTMKIAGDLTVDSGVIEIEVGGLGAGQYDVLNVLGGVTFTGGSILFKFIDGFLPQLGDAFDFLTATGDILGLGNVLFGYTGAAGGFLFDVTALTDGRLHFAALNDAGAVPEPSSIAIFAVGLLLLLGIMRVSTQARESHAQSAIQARNTQFIVSDSVPESSGLVVLGLRFATLLLPTRRRNRRLQTSALAAICLAWMATLAPAQAGYIDPVTNREWRQVTETAGFTWNTIATTCATDGATACGGGLGGLFQGWTWATVDQVGELFQHFGTHPSGIAETFLNFLDPNAVAFFASFDPTSTLNDPSIQQTLIQGWSSTAFNQSIVDRDGSVVVVPHAYDPVTYIATRQQIVCDPRRTPELCSEVVYGNPSSSTDWATTAFSSPSGPALGAWLWRAAPDLPEEAVPEPAAFLLLATALAGLGIARRRAVSSPT